ncbi:head-tail connector protein [Methylobacterium isbiliense]|uniref:Phage gp6-like head-tail connector protein n=1 Tax=Methylobacterium isbiliense TaxID=315478 RepID=A0ABQ4SEC2_9HYPH|nr:head-tail connector protein [Methylobacterium isbiliense]MDN3621459.1 head-tail connector protein [Methylobacterium isbiliense]GJE00904.1 hypothetical protein GMJLKIPL_2831 [Methylobacterium isbiliense]
MSSVTRESLKAHLNVTSDLDDAYLDELIEVAETWVAGFTGGMRSNMEPPLRQAVRMLAAHLYENREASLVGVTATELPIGVMDLLMPFRCWAF